MASCEYRIYIEGFSNNGIEPSRLVWLDPCTDMKKLRKDIAKWLERKYRIIVPREARLKINHATQSITLAVPEYTPPPRRTMASVDQDLMASLM